MSAARARLRSTGRVGRARREPVLVLVQPRNCVRAGGRRAQGALDHTQSEQFTVNFKSNLLFSDCLYPILKSSKDFVKFNEYFLKDHFTILDHYCNNKM